MDERVHDHEIERTVCHGVDLLGRDHRDAVLVPEPLLQALAHQGRSVAEVEASAAVATRLAESASPHP